MVKRSHVLLPTLLAPTVTGIFLVFWMVYMNQQCQGFEDFAADLPAFRIAMMVLLGLLTFGTVYCLISGASFLGFLSAVSVLLGIGLSYQLVCKELPHYLPFFYAGIPAAILVYFFWRRWNGLNQLLYGLLVCGTAGLLLANLLFGETIYGAKLWLKLGPISFQPGEILKIFVILLGACSYRNTKRTVTFCVMSLVICLCMVLLHDLGCAVVVFGIFLWMTYVLLDNRAFSIGLALIALAAFVLVISHNDYARLRMSSTFHAMEINEQQAEIIRAVILGGFSGLGVENASIITSIFAADTDSALAGVMAVFGHPILWMVLIAYALLIIHPSYNSSLHAANHLILVQASIYIFIQALLNFGGSLDFLPFSGIVAPLISSGGSSMVCFCVLMGLCAASLHPELTTMEVSNHA